MFPLHSSANSVVEAQGFVSITLLSIQRSLYVSTRKRGLRRGAGDVGGRKETLEGQWCSCCSTLDSGEGVTSSTESININPRICILNYSMRTA